MTASTTPHLDALITTARTIREAHQAHDYAYGLAIGVSTDDGDATNPTICAVVYENKLFHLSVNDAYAASVAAGTMTWAEVLTLVNAVVVNAFVQWRAEYARLLDFHQAHGGALAPAGDEGLAAARRIVQGDRQ